MPLQTLITQLVSSTAKYSRMGRPNQSPAIISHFSHPHPLCITTATYPPAGAGVPCVGCALPATASSSPSYACSQCNFLLHLTCASLPALLIHPCDPSHGLALLACPPYPDLRYTCDACARPGVGFVYHCAACGLDLHARCATAPMAVSCSAHAQHALGLAFGSPYGEEKGFTCDACGRGGTGREWLYRCATCEFDVHLTCGSGAVPSPQSCIAPAAVGGSGRRGGSLVETVAQGIAVGLVQGITGGGGGGGADVGAGAGFVVDVGQKIIGGMFGGSD